MRNKKIPVTVLLGSILLLVIILLVIAAPLFTSYAPDEAIAERLQKFSFSHPFGTDRYGRDIFCRTLYGGRTTLTACFIALAMALFIGTFFGIVTGMRSYGLLDTILMRVIDVLMAFPFMVFAMVFAALWGTGLINLLIAVVAVWWVPFARLARSIVLQVKSEPSIQAARVLGVSGWRMGVFELLPKMIGSLLVLATFELGTLILSVSALSFLGMGALPPTPEWGSMLSDARAHFFQAPHILLGPALFIVLTVLSLNLIGEGLRDMLDPYEHIDICN